MGWNLGSAIPLNETPVYRDDLGVFLRELSFPSHCVCVRAHVCVCVVEIVFMI